MIKKTDILIFPSQTDNSEVESPQGMSPTKKEEELNKLLRLTLTKCMEILQAKSGSIFLFDEKSKDLVLKTASNGRDDPREGIRQPLGEGIAGLVASRREPVLVEDINKDARFLQRRRFNHYQTHSFLSAPLEVSGELIGVINITERQSNAPFNNQDLKLLLELCNLFSFFIYQFKKFVNGEPQDLQNTTKLSEKFSLPSRLAAGLIHELNNPLDGIIRYVNLSLNCQGEESIVKEYLLEAKKGLNRIVKIVRSLLDFRQTTSSTPGTIDINKTLEESIFLMDHYFLSGKVRINRQLQQDLPLFQDHGLKLVFTNILKNACDAIGWQEGNIGVASAMNNGFVEVKISDTGPGVPEEIKNKIFEPFFTTKEIGKGSGLGLAICLNIIEKYRGCVLLESKPGKETIFTIRLPVDKPLKNK